MVVHEIDVKSTAVNETKNNPPVGANGHRMESLERTLQGMKPKARMIQVLQIIRGIKISQNNAYPIRHVLRDLASIVFHIEQLQPLMMKSPDH
jgi:hypothetical protein